MKRWILLGMCFLMGVCFLFPQGMKVVSPRARDSWWKGKTYTVKWETPAPANKRVRILVFSRGGRPFTVAANIKNTGFFNWQIPDMFKSGIYKIRIFIMGQPIRGDSKAFRITCPSAPGKAGIPTPAHAATHVGVTTALNWQAGANTISHNLYFGTVRPGIRGTFKGNLKDANYNPGPLKPNTQYYWRVDELGACGRKSIGSIWGFKTGAEGVPLTGITLTNPRPGQTYGVGRQIPINWTAAGISGTVKVQLVRTDSTASHVIKTNLSLDESPVEFTIPSGLSPGAYFIKIEQEGVPNPQVFTSGDFNIRTASLSLAPPTRLFALPQYVSRKYQVYLGWRLGDEDSQVGYNVYRRKPGEQEYIKLNTAPISDSTDFVDSKAVKADQRYCYYVCAVDPSSGNEGRPSAEVSVLVRRGANRFLYKRINKIAGNTSKAKVKAGDIDGDGLPDFLVVTRPFEITGSIEPGGGITGRQIKAGDIHAKVYYNDGKPACDIDMHETEKISRAPWTLWDVNNDGKAEVVGVMKKSAESPNYCLMVIDPTYAASPHYRVLSSIDVPTVRPPTTRFKTISVAYLDGRNPYILYASGHLKGQPRYVGAYTYDDARGLRLRWKHEEGPDDGIASSHQFEVADIDGDGKDEVFFGVYVFDENGRLPGYWGGHAWRHVDGVHIGDIMPDIPGLEAYFYIEEYPGGIHVTDKSGRVSWMNVRDCPGCKHAHAGWIGNVVSQSKGMEVWVYHKQTDPDDEGEKGMVCPFLYSANGEKFSGSIDLSWGPVHWNGDVDANGEKYLQVIDGAVVKQIEASGKRLRMSPVRPGVLVDPGPKIAMDVIGDYREEVLSFFSDRQGDLYLSIYTNTLKNNRRAPSPCCDRQYLQKHCWSGH